MTKNKIKSHPVKLFFSNVPNQTQEINIFDLFNPFGKIVNIAFNRDKKGKSTGSGFVEFEDPKNVDRAIESLNGTKYHNLNLYLKPYIKKHSNKSKHDDKFFSMHSRASDINSDYNYDYNSDSNYYSDDNSNEYEKEQRKRNDDDQSLKIPPPSLPPNVMPLYPSLSPNIIHSLLAMQNPPGLPLNPSINPNGEMVYWALKRHQVVTNLQKDAYEMMAMKNDLDQSKSSKEKY